MKSSALASTCSLPCTRAKVKLHCRLKVPNWCAVIVGIGVDAVLVVFNGLLILTPFNQSPAFVGGAQVAKWAVPACLGFVVFYAVAAFLIPPAVGFEHPSCGAGVSVFLGVYLSSSMLYRPQPDQFDVYPGRVLQLAAGAQPVLVAVHKELKQNLRGVGRAALAFVCGVGETKLRHIQGIDKQVDHPRQRVLGHGFFQ